MRKNMMFLCCAAFCIISSLYSMEPTSEGTENINVASKEKYPGYFVDVPEKYHDKIITYANEYQPESRLECAMFILCSDPIPLVKYRLVWGAIAYPDFYIKFESGTTSLFFFSSLLKGIRIPFGKLSEGTIQRAVGQYKIHLMPKGNMCEDLEELCNVIKNNEKLQSSISEFKLFFEFNDNVEQREDIPPKIVIYCADGKENAQTVLDEIYKAFKDKQGLDIIPRYNKRVTSYIYYAQGDANDKEVLDLQKYFEQPGMVHFKANVTGQEQIYHLKIPEEQGVEEEKKEENVEEKKEEGSWFPSFIKNNYNALLNKINAYNATFFLGTVGVVGIAGYYAYKTWLKK